MLIALLLLVDTYICSIIINLTSRGIIIINSTTRFISLTAVQLFRGSVCQLIKRLLLMMNVFKLYPFSRYIQSESLSSLATYNTTLHYARASCNKTHIEFTYSCIDLDQENIKIKITWSQRSNSNRFRLYYYYY